MGTRMATLLILRAMWTAAPFLRRCVCSHARLVIGVQRPGSVQAIQLSRFMLCMPPFLRQGGSLVIEAHRPARYRELGGLLPCLASNTLILAVALQNSLNTLTFSQSVRSGLGAGIGFSLVLILFCAICERLTAADVPRPFRGAAITMISAGLMSMAFMGLSGLV